MFLKVGGKKHNSAPLQQNLLISGSWRIIYLNERQHQIEFVFMITTLNSQYCQHYSLHILEFFGEQSFEIYSSQTKLSFCLQYFQTSPDLSETFKNGSQTGVICLSTLGQLWRGCPQEVGGPVLNLWVLVKGYYSWWADLVVRSKHLSRIL